MTVSFAAVVRRAFDRRATWDKVYSKALVTDLVTRWSGVRVDWDGGAGEEWASLLSDASVEGIVSMVMPLTIVRTHRLDSTRHAAAPYGVDVFAVDDFDARNLTLDDDLAAALGVDFDPEQFDPSRFSVMEFWWATI
ncbi:MAG TPA: hypothetical protein VFQ85_03155 [Mycobacteriales bacterium]|jgi:hypothetical protein|nr:hypothetical protein [Mycobacteriales bacterium]